MRGIDFALPRALLLEREGVADLGLARFGLLSDVVFINRLVWSTQVEYLSSPT